MITEREIIKILESNILPGFKDIIGIFKDDYVDKRKPIFKKIAKDIIDRIKENVEEVCRLKGQAFYFKSQDKMFNTIDFLQTSIYPEEIDITIFIKRNR